MRGINKNCLFADVNTAGRCLGETHEHVIQEGVGGRYERNDVICDECNIEFGNTIDQNLIDYYSVLIDVLRALMPSRFQKHMRHGHSLNKKLPLLLKPGGVVEIRKLHKEYNQDGSLKAINAPYDYPHDKLRAMALKEGKSKNPTVSHVPITHVDECAIYKLYSRFDEKTHRAAAKTILEVIDFQTKDMKLKPYARMPALKSARNYIRNGVYNQYSDRITCPMYYLNDEFEKIFGPTKEEDFTNRVIFCNNSASGYCYGFIQIANTLPLGLCLGNAVEERNFSLIYEANILKKNGNKQGWISRFIEGVVISQSEIHWASFVSRTRESVMFAHSVLRRSVDHQLGRARFLVDMKCDELMRKTLKQYAIDAVTRHRAGLISSATLLRAICEPLLRVQFQFNSILEKDWNDAFSLCSASGLASDRLDTSSIIENIDDSQIAIILNYFRKVVQCLVGIDGYPRALISLTD